MPESFNALYLELRLRLRSYTRVSIIMAALTELAHEEEDRLEALKRAPWLTLLIAKWALQDTQMGDGRGAPITPHEFHDLRQRLWQFPERMPRRAIKSVTAFIRRMIHTQLAFQVRPTLGFLLESALIADLPSDHTLHRMFVERTGLTPTQFMDFAFATYTAVIEDKAKVIRFGWFKPLRDAYGESAFQSFVTVVSARYEDLSLFTRNLMRSNHRHESEYFEFTPLRRFPFIRGTNGLRLWHPMVFYRGMEGIVHSILSEAGDQYTIPFSRLFERHVVAQMHGIAAVQLGEQEIRDILGQQSKVTDGLLAFGTANVYVEAKVGIFKDAVMVVEEAEYFRTVTRSLAKAVEQGWAASVGMRQADAAPEVVRSAATDYLLVVTNWEYAVGDGKKLREMYPDGKLEYPDTIAQQYLPLSNAFFISIDDYERLMEAVKSDGLSLPDFLSSCVTGNANPVTAKHLFDQHLTAGGVRLGRSKLLQNAIEASTVRLESILGNG